MSCFAIHETSLRSPHALPWVVHAFTGSSPNDSLLLFLACFVKHLWC